MVGSLFARAGHVTEARHAFEVAVQSKHAEIAPMAATELTKLKD